ncbi:hypothetical protein K402DRAFT_466133 [Aulographum hederae CBS 113979]|uniref:KRR1 small subunit processome component n=1 Tax=Aulographum hederae CBS 113979 TaxID=1176131 RepID=A0A6G1GRF7_9PEZI|nr:hypothetical protein K402DRAFT_466133 [Aulographum hederae CBS 113979]
MDTETKEDTRVEPDAEEIEKFNKTPFTREDNVGGTFTEESSFATLFPKYREQYLREAWPLITRALLPSGITGVLNLVEGSMTVTTTRKTFDPAAILNARDLIRLLARSVPAPQAVKILADNTACDIIKIRNLVRNKERMAKRRQRILGPNGTTLKALELLTGCYILVQGATVAAMGSYKGLADVRRIVEDCMRNIHPIYHIKTLMIRRELAADPALANEDWSRFLPQYAKRNQSHRHKPKKIREKGPYTPFPPQQEKSKIDLQIESGEFFLAKGAKERKAREEREEKVREKMEEKKRKRAKEFVAPKEEGKVGKWWLKPKSRERQKKDAEEEVGGGSGTMDGAADDYDGGDDGGVGVDVQMGDASGPPEPQPKPKPKSKSKPWPEQKPEPRSEPANSMMGMNADRARMINGR